ncbi:hypothetical protein EUBDOL_02189 [Amedibacillus dolichus DSM 3991]|uniref:Uncharacterized protein n=1 Tax=Amedibacillus dolichus DSM 3991 TaxID=428127 RepID=A8RFA3_9FIRM|nr:hypothetical protein EUBDOL_02189 [Amedibacillus dolichus DSM 3991]
MKIQNHQQKNGYVHTYLPLAQFVSKVLNRVVKLGHLPTIAIVRYILKNQAKTSKIENQQKWNHL